MVAIQAEAGGEPSPPALLLVSLRSAYVAQEAAIRSRTGRETVMLLGRTS